MGGILPWLIGGAVALYLYNKNKSSADGSTVTASNGTSVTLPGLTVPPSLQPLTSDDVTIARSIIDGSWAAGSRGERLDSIPGYETAAPRLKVLQDLLDEWGSVGRDARVPDLRTALILG